MSNTDALADVAKRREDLRIARKHHDEARRRMTLGATAEAAALRSARNWELHCIEKLAIAEQKAAS